MKDQMIMVPADTLSTKPRHHYECGALVIEGDVPAGTRIDCDGDLEIRGHVGRDCIIKAGGRFVGHDIGSGARVIAGMVQAHRAHAYAEVLSTFGDITLHSIARGVEIASTHNLHIAHGPLHPLQQKLRYQGHLSVGQHVLVGKEIGLGILQEGDSYRIPRALLEDPFPKPRVVQDRPLPYFAHADFVNVLNDLQHLNRPGKAPRLAFEPLQDEEMGLRITCLEPGVRAVTKILIGAYIRSHTSPERTR